MKQDAQRPKAKPIGLIADSPSKPEWAKIRPKNAGTLILVDSTGRKPRVLMGKRHERHRFMPGKYVFPGGRVDPADSRIQPLTEFDEKTKARLLYKMRGGERPALARGFALAAIRETFEETGLLVGRKTDTAPASKSASWGRFFSHGIAPALDDVAFIARAITPPRRPRRFDARFFAVEASAIASDAGRKETPEDELLELDWLSFDQARSIDIPNVTRMVLTELEQRMLNGGIHAPHHKVPFIYLHGRSFVREEL